MNQSEIQTLKTVAHTVRALSIDAIELAQSGHPGMALGAADFGAYFFAKVLRHNPKNPEWLGRDRFVLSAGHGSMLLYALLHLTGYDVTIEDLKSFRQLHSRTPGHPELGKLPGVETTTGPLGQGVACGTGMAIAQKLIAARMGEELFDAKVWVLAGDGCMMEGISSEASCLAGTMGLDNLVIIYDANQVCLDGPITEVNLENTAKRFEAYGFKVLSIDGYDYDQMELACRDARLESEKPVFILLNTVIGKYAPAVEGTWKAHGGHLGADEVAQVKKNIGWELEPFAVPDEVVDYFEKMRPEWNDQETDWNERFKSHILDQPEMAQRWEKYSDKSLPDDFEEQVWGVDIPPGLPTRKCNEYAINKVCQLAPWVLSGSADASSCDFTWLMHSEIVQKENWFQQQIKFGVREFAMAASAYGIAIHGFFTPAVGTFLTFSDYMRNAMRMTALMKQKVIFVFSHDSVFLAEDGPTHQPVEHLMSLRLIPNMTLIRPGDENEVKAAWLAALKVKDGPVALCFSRQNVASTLSELTAAKALRGVEKGAYLLWGEEGDCDVLMIATGSEIHPAVGAAKILKPQGKTARVISMPSWELFEAQDVSYRENLLGGNIGLRVSVEAGASLGWQKYVGENGLSISIDEYGASAPADVLIDHFGFTAEKVANRITENI